MKNLLVILFMLALIGCSSDDGTKPDFVGVLKKKLALTASYQTSVILECEGLAAINNDFNRMLGVEEKSTAGVAKSTISDLICNDFITGMMKTLFKSGIPSAWQCKATKLDGVVDKIVTKVCTK